LEQGWQRENQIVKAEEAEMDKTPRPEQGAIDGRARPYSWHPGAETEAGNLTRKPVRPGEQATW